MGRINGAPPTLPRKRSFAQFRDGSGMRVWPSWQLYEELKQGCRTLRAARSNLPGRRKTFYILVNSPQSWEKHSLSCQEEELVALFRNGCDSKEIAFKLGKSAEWVAETLQRAAETLGLEEVDEFFLFPRLRSQQPVGSILTAGECEVAELLVQGLSNGSIASNRRTSVRTVANQVGAILRKTGFFSRRELRRAVTIGAYKFDQQALVSREGPVRVRNRKIRPTTSEGAEIWELLSVVGEIDPSRIEELTIAERDVLSLASTGLSNKAIAAIRGSASRTVVNQISSILRKTGLRTRLHLPRLASSMTEHSGLTRTAKQRTGVGHFPETPIAGPCRSEIEIIEK